MCVCVCVCYFLCPCWKAQNVFPQWLNQLSDSLKPIPMVKYTCIHTTQTHIFQTHVLARTVFSTETRYFPLCEVQNYVTDHSCFCALSTKKTGASIRSKLQFNSVALQVVHIYILLPGSSLPQAQPPSGATA